jgi:anti-sigma regulatory factor (Ser/Thr protein kinase)
LTGSFLLRENFGVGRNLSEAEIPAEEKRAFALRVDTTLDALGEVLTWFESFRNAGIPDPIWLECQLVLAEGFTNAVRHAHRALPASTPIDIQLTLTPQGLELRIWDQGQEFDLEGFAQNLAANPLPDAESEGGRGILLMKALSTHLSYTHQADGRNCLLISRRFDDPGCSSQQAV